MNNRKGTQLIDVFRLSIAVFHESFMDYSYCSSDSFLLQLCPKHRNCNLDLLHTLYAQFKCQRFGSETYNTLNATKPPGLFAGCPRSKVFKGEFAKPKINNNAQSRGVTYITQQLPTTSSTAMIRTGTIRPNHT